MGLLDWFRRIKKGRVETIEKIGKSESSGLNSKSESSQESMLVPPVEHPLLTIQDKISKLEEIYRRLDEKVDQLATREDAEEIKDMLSESLERGGDLAAVVSRIEERVEFLQEQKRELTRKIDVSTVELTQNLERLSRVEKELELLKIDQDILNSLKEQEMSTIELSKKLGYTRQHLWGRLKRLQEAGIVESFKEGRQTKYRVLKEDF